MNLRQFAWAKACRAPIERASLTRPRTKLFIASGNAMLIVSVVGALHEIGSIEVTNIVNRLPTRRPHLERILDGGGVTEARGLSGGGRGEYREE